MAMLTLQLQFDIATELCLKEGNYLNVFSQGVHLVRSGQQGTYDNSNLAM